MIHLITKSAPVIKMSSLYQTTKKYDDFRLLGSHLPESLDESSGRLEFRYRVLCRKRTDPAYKFSIVVKMSKEKAHLSEFYLNDLEQEALRMARERIDNVYETQNGYKHDVVYIESI